MRKALNDNPTLQIVVVGVLLAVGALFFAMSSGGGAAKPPATAATPAANSGAAPSGAAPGATTSAPAVAMRPAAFVPGPALPRPVFAAYQADRVVVLLLARGGGIDDELVRSSVAALGGRPDVSVFVVPARHASRYAAVTEALGVDRAPALVVLKPRHLSGGAPEGEVHYGFRGAASVRQAVRDALYSGPERRSFAP